MRESVVVKGMVLALPQVVLASPQYECLQVAQAVAEILEGRAPNERDVDRRQRIRRLEDRIKDCES